MLLQRSAKSARPLKSDDKLDRSALQLIVAGCFAMGLNLSRCALHLSGPWSRLRFSPPARNKNHFVPEPASLAAHPATLAMGIEMW
ncbi:hypothetical protein DSCA_53370 [Desulfosarcina alkanivorans]|uniref:Uncharacterized protein n=1 Tax=Desulfosarcina alkanivorans TaxID=571177 RepID=A0A5K7Z460_9BACT|nr:hypothetical protein DSCA_53370 [Desulfosarcina alkanivorans]